jgi:formylglycine-generating enzyme required for sulfatase activity
MLNQAIQITYRVPPIQSSYIEPEMIYINGGNFMMESSDENGEKKFQSIAISSFYLGKYTVTNKEYCLYKTSHDNPGDNLPVVKVSWNDAVDYCKWLSEKTGKNYRLPAEAEWEYSCRAGTTTEYYWGNEIDDSYCWYLANSGGKVHPVGEKQPNGWGLYDMAGNVWEWCSDWYDSSNSCRVDRGGCGFGLANLCRSAVRHGSDPSCQRNRLGFRLSMTP